MNSTTFRAGMWAAMQDLFTRILAHPFIAGLTDRSLSRDAFAYCVIQDSHYLVDYACALALVGAKAPAPQNRPPCASG
jgi:thiaminase (transcriptional activator TenA)